MADNSITTATWSKKDALPGDTLTLNAATSQSLVKDQYVEFRIWNGTELIDTLKADSGKTKTEWRAPNIPGKTNLKFRAYLRQPPTPQNGQVTIASVKESSACALTGSSIEVTSIDNAFVPKQEKLELKYKISGQIPKKGRYEIWAERYSTQAAVYHLDFVPAAGETTWNAWDGKATEAGPLKDKYLTPEFSPYRVKIIVGPDDDSVKDPYGKGRGIAVCSERQFEVSFLSIAIKVQPDISVAVAATLNDALKIEPRTPKGEFAASGRLPLFAEPALAAGWAPGAPVEPLRPGVGRLRIPCPRFRLKDESLNQGYSGGQHNIGDPYMRQTAAGPGLTKHAIDAGYYTRPEIPVVFEAHLKSRTAAKNGAPDYGLFEPEAVGPALFDVLADEAYLDRLFTTDGTAQSQTFFRNSALKIKRGTHNNPHHSGGTPEITFWQERFLIAADGDREVGNTAEHYTVGSNELTVWLNRIKLTLGQDYTEMNNQRIRLNAGMTRANDVVWIIRKPSAAAAAPPPAWNIPNWDSAPPGANCHMNSGGVRGEPPTNDLVYCLRKNFSVNPVAPREPIIGTDAVAVFPYKDLISLDPYNIPVQKRERVHAQAMTAAGTNLGRAGIIFSPSYIAGDSYSITAALKNIPFTRNTGWQEPRRGSTGISARTGTISVWRKNTVNSWHLRHGAPTLAANVGITDPALAARTHPGEGVRMNPLSLNTLSEGAFNEWEIPVAAAPVAPGEPHRDINFATYRAQHNTYAGTMGAGFRNLTNDNEITDDFVQWDHYRVQLPPGIPANRQNTVSNALHQAVLQRGTRARDAANAATAAINAHDAVVGPGGADQALNAGVAAIPLSPPGTTPRDYITWAENTVQSVGFDILDRLFPPAAHPREVNIVRWPNYLNVWCRHPILTADIISGICIGSGQLYYSTNSCAIDTFEHELGHALVLTHFATGRPTNSCWKHHDHSHQRCKMGYINKTYTVPLPAGSPGPALNFNTGARAEFCPKCLLKMRGWQEEVVPCNWTHPAVF